MISSLAPKHCIIMLDLPYVMMVLLFTFSKWFCFLTSALVLKQETEAEEHETPAPEATAETHIFAYYTRLRILDTSAIVKAGELLIHS